MVETKTCSSKGFEPWENYMAYRSDTFCQDPKIAVIVSGFLDTDLLSIQDNSPLTY